MPERADLKFIRGFIRNPTHVGAIAPSSAWLARFMLRDIDLSDRASVLEFGPGTGPITKEIERVVDCPTRYLGIERDPHFVEVLVERFPAMRFVEGSAEDAVRHIRESGIENLRLILSGLPFATLPREVQDGIVAALKELMVEGVSFRTFQYLHALAFPAAVRFRKMMRRSFGPCKISRPVMLNLPPAVVLSWTR